MQEADPLRRGPLDAVDLRPHVPDDEAMDERDVNEMLLSAFYGALTGRVCGFYWLAFQVAHAAPR